MKKILTGIIFYPMLWLRGIFFAISTLLSGFLLLMAVFWFVVNPEHEFSKPVLMPLGLAFLLFMFRWVYDEILLKLNPTDHVLYLEQ